MHLVAIAFGAWFVWFLVRHCTRVEREQMVSLLVMILGVLVFFTLYEQTYGSWLTFTDRLLSKDLFSLSLGDYTAALPWAVYSLAVSPPLMIAALMVSDRGHGGLAKSLVGLMAVGLAVAIAHDVVLVPQTAGSLTFLGAFFIVVLAPVFSWLWPWLDKRGLNPSKPAKMGIGLVFAGLSFIPLLMAAQQIGATGVMASVWWLVLAYFVLEIGEMCLSPIGLSAVTQLSVARVVGLMMGAFWLGTAYSEVIAAQFGKLASLDIVEGEAIDMAVAAGKYAHLFEIMLWIGIGSGVVFLLLTPVARRWMHGVK
jgi:POT family proton-dependent oligopeptide transporter